MPVPDLSVIIPHYNDTVRLARCLAALDEMDRSGVEIVVVDNGSTDPLSQIEAAHPYVRFITEPTKGAAAARNRGMAETSAPALVFLDADCVPAPDWLDVARKHIQESTLLGGRITVFDETPSPRSGAEAFETVFAFDQESYVRDKGFSVTANLLTTRAVVDATGPMIVGVSEDLEWCQRAVGKGFRLDYLPALVVSHPTRQDWAALAKKWRRTTAEAHGLAGGSLGWWGKAVMMPISALAHAPRMLTHGALTPGERLRGLGTLFRLRIARMIWMIRLGLGQKIT